MPDPWETRPDRQVLGRTGEDLAVAAYAALGYACVERRWRVGVGELDLVLRRDRVLVFCEVKTRRGSGWGRPEEAVTRRRLARLRTVARRYLAERPPRGVDVFRFDVAAVEVEAGRGEVRIRLLQGVG